MENFMKYDFNANKILLACRVQSGQGAPVHIDRPGHGLALYTGGECRFHFDNQTLLARKNDIIYLPKGSSYTVEQAMPAEGVICYAINFDISAQADFPPFVIRIKNAAAVLRLFIDAEQAWRTKKSGYTMACKADLYRILCIMQQENELGYVTGSTARALDAAISYVHENYTDQPISIGYLAGLCGMSETHFRATFKRVYGISPLKYINDLKLTRAKELLSSQMYTVGEAARLSGFGDEAYFSREFKKAVGLCPSKFAEHS